MKHTNKFARLKKDEIIVLILIVGAALLRLVPHPANFAPISAIAIFGAFYLKDKRLAFAAPLVAMFISDAIIGFYQWPIMAAVYLSFLISACLGLWLKGLLTTKKNTKVQNTKRHRDGDSSEVHGTHLGGGGGAMLENITNGLGISLFASLQFFIITNFAVWVFGTMYAKNLAGLINCYYMAIPFFRNTILGDLFYLGVLFGAYALVNYLVINKKLALKTK